MQQLAVGGDSIHHIRCDSGYDTGKDVHRYLVKVSCFLFRFQCRMLVCKLSVTVED